MRTSVALLLYVSLTSSHFGQEARKNNGTASPEQSAASTLTVRRYLAAGHYGDAERELRISISASVPDSAATTNLRIALADLLREEGRDSDGRQMFAAILNDSELSWIQHLDVLMGITGIDGHMGAMRASSAEWGAAITLARDHQDTAREADCLRGLATSWLDGGNPSQAEPLLHRAMKLLEASPSATRWEIAATWAAEGAAYQAQDKMALAEEAWTKALDLNRLVFGKKHPQVAWLMERLAVVYSRRQEFELARHHAALAAAVPRQACGEASLAVATALVVQGDIEANARAWEAAAAKYGEALTLARNIPDGQSTAERIMLRYAGVLKENHHDREAKAMMSAIKSFRGK